jgi:hypothetical protein
VIASGSDKVFVQADVTLLPALFVRNPGSLKMGSSSPVSGSSVQTLFPFELRRR